MGHLSGDTTGKHAPIKLTSADVSSSPREIHSVPPVETHQIWLDAINRSAAQVTVTVLKGGTTDPDHAEKVIVGAYERKRVYDGMRVSGTTWAAGKICAYIALADANKISLDGHYNRIE